MASTSTATATMETHTFVALEGVYTMTEEHKPPPLYSNQAQGNYPTRISQAVIRFPPPKQASQGFSWSGKTTTPANTAAASSTAAEDRSISLSSSDTPGDELDTSAKDPSEAPAPTLFDVAANKVKRKKSTARPKHNARTTSSTFVTRLHTLENLSKHLQLLHGEHTFLFYNAHKSFFWIEAGIKSKEPLARITFSAFPTCHDVNRLSSSHEHIDVVMGFSTGDLIWFDPMSSRYVRINKQGTITSSACTAVRWAPVSPALFVVAHVDGSMIIYDRERDDGAFSLPSPSVEVARIRPWDPCQSMLVSMSPWHPNREALPPGTSTREKEKDKVKNPVSHWRVSQKAIVAFEFSPDSKHIAAVGEDGRLRIIDALDERLVDTYASYFGALTCVCWTPDGRFLLAGGQDDLVTIFAPAEQRVVARCQGHSAFVSSISCDASRCRDGRTYRFGSVGEDGRLLLWDFSSGALHRPKVLATMQTRMSMSSTLSLALRGTAPIPGSSADDFERNRFHPSPSRTEVAVVQPLLAKPLEGELLSAICFLPTALVTASKTGLVKYWVRPLSISRTRRARVRGGEL